MTNNQTVCDRDRIQQFLEQKLTDADLSAFEGHLNDCDDCRRQLETAVASEDIWSEMRDSLRGDCPDFRRAPAQQGGENGTVPFAADAPQSGDSDSSAAEDVSSSQATILKLLAPTDDDRSLGRWGTYEVVGVVGTGGMGVVLKAFDIGLNRYVAIKILAPHLGSSGAARKRFSREAQASAAVVHDNVIEIYGVSEAAGLPYLVMPYVRGPSLQRRLNDAGPLAVVEILRVGMQAAAGLAAAHAQGLVHRDVKPANILLADGIERVKLTDFGLARAADDASLTRTGIIAGTPQYMSPEQARGEPVDQRSDLFSLGSVHYAMCTGRPPFRAETSYGVLRRITDDEPRPIREINPEIPEWLCGIVAKLMAKQPDDRFQSASEVSALLEQCLAHVQQPTVVPLPNVLISLRRDAGGEGGVDRATCNNDNKDHRDSRDSTRRRRILAAAIALLFFGGLVASGILIKVKKDRKTTTIEVPDESKVHIGPQGAVTVELPSSEGIVDLFGGTPIPVATLEQIEAAFGKSGLSGYNLQGGHVMVPRAQRAVYMAALAGIHALPQNPNQAEEEGGKTPGMVSQFEFGPVVDLILPEPAADSACLLNLSTGKLLVPEPAVASKLRLEEFSALEVSAAMTKANVDLIGIADHTGIPGEEHGMTLFDGIALDPVAWTDSANEVVRTLQNAEQPIESSRKKGDFPPYCYLRTSRIMPRTFAIKSRSGQMGVVQLIAYVEKPAGFKVRYKLVRSKGAKSTTPEAPGTISAPRAPAFNFNVSLAVTRKDTISPLNACLPQRLGEAIAKLDGIAEVTSGLVDIQPIDEFGSDPIVIQGFPPGDPWFKKCLVGTGHGECLSQRNRGKRQLMIGSELARIKKLKVGDALTVADERFTIIGIFDCPTDLENKMVVMLLEDLQKYAGKLGQITGCSVKLDKAHNNPECIKTIKAMIEGKIADELGLHGKIQATLTSDVSPKDAAGANEPYTGTVGEISASGVPSDAASSGSKPLFEARLPSGVTVELLGVSENPSKDKPWWRPDGSPLPERPYDWLGASVGAESGKISRAAEKVPGTVLQFKPADPPQLRFLAWQDDYTATQPRGAFHPDGSPADSPSDLQTLAFVQPVPCDAKSTQENHRNPPFLHVWFSHPLFDKQSVKDVTFLDEEGKLLPSNDGIGMMSYRTYSSKDANGRGEGLGWLVYTQSPKIQSRTVTVRLRYTVGPLESAGVVEVKPNAYAVASLEGGSQLGSIGQNVDGKAFVGIAVNSAGMKDRSFAALAVTKDGRELEPLGVNIGGNQELGARKEEFTFDEPLSGIAKFRIGTRPIRTVEFRNVSVRVGQKSDVQVVVPAETRKPPASVSSPPSLVKSILLTVLKAGRGTALDLTRDKTIDVPRGFDRYYVASQEAQWCIDNGADVFFEPPEGVSSSSLKQPIILLVRSWGAFGIGDGIADKRLEDVTDKDIAKAFASMSATDLPRPIGVKPPYPPVRDKNIPEWQEQADERELGCGPIVKMPSVIVVETQKGQAVLLEISGFTEGKSKVKIRYKLLKAESSRSMRSSHEVGRTDHYGTATSPPKEDPLPTTTALPVYSLLHVERVCKELRLSHQQKEKLRQIALAYEMGCLKDQMEREKGNAKASTDESWERLRRSVRTQVEQVLTPAQVDKCKAWVFQRFAWHLIESPSVQHDIGLTAEQDKARGKTMADAREAVLQIFREAGAKALQNLTPAQLQALKEVGKADLANADWAYQLRYNRDVRGRLNLTTEQDKIIGELAEEASTKLDQEMHARLLTILRPEQRQKLRDIVEDFELGPPADPVVESLSILSAVRELRARQSNLMRHGHAEYTRTDTLWRHDGKVLKTPLTNTTKGKVFFDESNFCLDATVDETRLFKNLDAKDDSGKPVHETVKDHKIWTKKWAAEWEEDGDVVHLWDPPGNWQPERVDPREIGKMFVADSSRLNITRANWERQPCCRLEEVFPAAGARQVQFLSPQRDFVLLRHEIYYDNAGRGNREKLREDCPFKVRSFDYEKDAASGVMLPVKFEQQSFESVPLAEDRKRQPQEASLTRFSNYSFEKPTAGVFSLYRLGVLGARRLRDNRKGHAENNWYDLPSPVNLADPSSVPDTRGLPADLVEQWLKDAAAAVGAKGKVSVAPSTSPEPTGKIVTSASKAELPQTLCQ